MTKPFRILLMVSTSALCFAACSDDGGGGEGGSSAGGNGAGGEASTGGSSAGGSGPMGCDGSGVCDTCQQCVYDEGGECESTLTDCMDNQACIDLNACMETCVGTDPTAFDGCLTQCNDDHPDGEDDYAAILSCVENACMSDCMF